MRKLILFWVLWLGLGQMLWAEKIAQYKTQIVVEQSGELVVTESISYDFEGLDKHGIYRDIPYTVKGDRLPKDLGFSDFSVLMDGQTIRWERSTLGNSDAGDMIRLKIGSPDVTMRGVHLFTIAYRVAKGVLPSSIRGEDAIRWNVIGTGWKVPIFNITSEIVLPASLGQESVTVRGFKGIYGSKTPTAKGKWRDSHHIEIKEDSLLAHEGVTIELSYAKGTLGQTGEENLKVTTEEKVLLGWHWIVLVGFLLYLWKMLKEHTGFKDARAIAVQYLPPEGLSVLQSGLLYNKFTDKKDYAPAVLALAQKGYLTITQENHKDHPILTKTTKSTSDLSADMHHLMDKVFFAKGKTHTLKPNSATESSLLEKGFSKINEMLYLWSVSEGYMRENPQEVRSQFLWKAILFFLPILALTFYTLYRTQDVAMMILPLFAFIFMGIGILIFMLDGMSLKIFGAIFVIVGMLPFSFFLFDGTPLFGLLLSPFPLIIIIPIAIYVVYRKMGAYTRKGASVQNHLLGLEAFMKRVKAEELRVYLEADPLYLEKALPYAVLFGMTKHWLDLFETLAVVQPIWFAGSARGLRDFGIRLERATTPPASSSGGYSGGGGSSGGGGGGGGGGSW